MPSRKSHGGDPHTDLGRSSMRRLSSIASLHQLLPFSRSRRNHGETDIPSSSQESFFSAGVSAVASDSTETSWTQSSEDGQQTQPASNNSTMFLKRDDYTCISEKPSSGIPRSRTFSNLPLPMPSRKKQQHRHQSITKAQERHSSPIAPTLSRLPTPTASNRRYFAFGNRTVNNSKSTACTKLKRSDTEPLLTARIDHEHTYHRSTAFTEDVTNASATVAPSTPHFGSSESISSSTTSHVEHKEKAKQLLLPRDRSFCGALPTTPKKSWSSPGNALVDDKTPTQSSYLAATAPIARHHNALADITNRYQSYQKAEVASVKSVCIAEGKSTSDDVDWSKKQDSARKPAPLRAVLEAQPTAYWSGRLSSILDRFQNQELAANVSASGSMTSRFETDKLYAPTANTSRTRRAFEELYSTCVTTDAKESFIAFQLQYAALRNEPELAKPIGPRFGRPDGYQTASSKSLKVATLDRFQHSSGGTRKTSFVDRLLGRNKRNNLA